jgi:hypothetical protein
VVTNHTIFLSFFLLRKYRYYIVMNSAVTVREAGIEPGTATRQHGCSNFVVAASMTIYRVEGEN